MRRPALGVGRFIAPLLCGAGCTLAACGWIVGASDYAVGDAGSDTTGDGPGSTPHDETSVDATVDTHDSADAGSDASASTTASSDVVTEAEAMATPGPHADAASPDAGGTQVVACGQGLASGQAAFDQIVRSCVLTVSCDPLDFPSNISDCITRNMLNSTGLYTCLSTLQDCNGFYQCWGLRIATAADCPSTAPAARCDAANNLAIDCNQLTVKNCTQYGGTCGTYTDQALNRRADCVVMPSCTETDGLSHCTGNGGLYTCVNGAGVGYNCTLFDGTCSTFNGAGTSCFLDGPPCTSPGYACSGGVLSYCSPASHRQERTFDCTAGGLSCDTSSDGGTGTCLAPGCTSLGTCPIESCGTDGKTLTVCVGGAPYTIDCSKMGSGFTGCTQLTQSSTGIRFGYCQ